MFKNLKTEMIKNGLNQKQLAKQIGMKTSTLSKKMSGKANFRLNDALKIINVINPGLSIDYLFCEA